MSWKSMYDLAYFVKRQYTRAGNRSMLNCPIQVLKAGYSY